MKRERGFTLIELLVVIAILAVLFGVTALALNGIGDDAETNTMVAETDVVQTALDICYNTTGCVVPTAPASGASAVTLTSSDLTYLRRTTKYYYCWDSSSGEITQGAQVADTPVCP